LCFFDIGIAVFEEAEEAQKLAQGKLRFFGRLVLRLEIYAVVDFSIIGPYIRNAVGRAADYAVR
jgi:hypothetical protein